MNETYLIYIVCSVLSFVPALVLHEVAHGFAAYKLGDPTAKRAGRLSLNPVKHRSIFRNGHLAVPPHGHGLAGVRLREARAPTIRRTSKDPRKGDFIVGLAGPLANLAMACVAGLLAHLLLGSYLGLSGNVLFDYFYTMFLPMFALINLYLMFFNLLPIPPLDGSSIFALLIPRRYMGKYYSVQRYAFPSS